MEIIPDYIVGDLDSIHPETVEHYKKYGDTVKFVEVPNQDKTDLMKAMDLTDEILVEQAEKKQYDLEKIKRVYVYQAFGTRIDHTL